MSSRVRFIVASLFAAGLLALLAPAAAAHDPIFVSDDQTTPDNGPYMPDGSISWALYGQVLSDGETRGFEFDLRDGDELYVSLLIPNLDPELQLGDDELPQLEIEAPDGTTRMLTADQRTIFDEPFSGTSYVTLLELREPGQAGRYRGVVFGAAPSRFTVAIGEEEIFFTETERSGDRPSSFVEITEPLQVWYSTPPGGEATGDTEGVGVDLEMIEEAMESDGGTISEGGSLDGTEPEETEPAAEPAPAPAPAAEPAPAPAPAAEPAPAPAPAAEPVPAPVVEKSGEVSEAAIDAVESDDDGSSTWVAPVVIAAVAVLGGVAFMASRRRSA